MSTSKHTPGKWQSIPDPHREPGHADVPRFQIWAGKRPIIDGYVLTEEDANLIAAAPDLYETLAEARTWFSADGPLARKFDAALRKARGEQEPPLSTPPA